MLSSQVMPTVTKKRPGGETRSFIRSSHGEFTSEQHGGSSVMTMTRIPLAPSFTIPSQPLPDSAASSPRLPGFSLPPPPDSISYRPPPPCPPSSIAGTYILILEPTTMTDVTIPLPVTISYETDWPLLLLTDQRPANVAEEGYLCLGNILACRAIRHLSSAVQMLESDIRAALYLRPQAAFTLSLPELNNKAVTPLVVIKSLVTQLMARDAGWMSSSHRASILGRGCYRLRVDYDSNDSLQVTTKYVARVCIQPPLSHAVTPRVVHFPITVNIEAIMVMQMVHDIINTYTPTGSSLRTGSNIRLFHENHDIMDVRAGGAILGGKMFRLVERRMCVDLEARLE